MPVTANITDKLKEAQSKGVSLNDLLLFNLLKSTNPDANKDLTVTFYVATGSGTGYSSGNKLKKVDLIDTSSTPPAISESLWINMTQQTVISAPSSGNISLDQNETQLLQSIDSKSSYLSDIRTFLYDGDVSKSNAQLLNEISNRRLTSSDNFLYGITGDITTTDPTQILEGTSDYFILTNITISNSHDHIGTWVNVTWDTTPLYTVFVNAFTAVTADVRIKCPGADKPINIQCETAANVRASISAYSEAPAS